MTRTTVTGIYQAEIVGECTLSPLSFTLPKALCPSGKYANYIHALQVQERGCHAFPSNSIPFVRHSHAFVGPKRGRACELRPRDPDEGRAVGEAGYEGMIGRTLEQVGKSDQIFRRVCHRKRSSGSISLCRPRPVTLKLQGTLIVVRGWVFLCFLCAGKVVSLFVSTPAPSKKLTAIDPLRCTLHVMISLSSICSIIKKNLSPSPFRPWWNGIRQFPYRS